MTEYKVERHVAYDMARHYGIPHKTAVDFSVMVETHGPTFNGEKAYDDSLKWLIEEIDDLLSELEIRDQ